MKFSYLYIFFFGILLPKFNCELGIDVVDVSKVVAESTFKCLLSNNYTFFT